MNRGHLDFAVSFYPAPSGGRNYTHLSVVCAKMKSVQEMAGNLGKLVN